MSLRFLLVATSVLLATGLLTSAGRAQNAPAAGAAPATWTDGIKFGAQIEGGVSFNPDQPKTNFGQLTTDHPNQAMLNQVRLGVERDIPEDVTGWDVGFRLQGLYGSDVRYLRFLGVFDYVTANRYQFGIAEANVSLHAPLLAGLDVKAGMYLPPFGFEASVPLFAPFYSHSYIFSFGVPGQLTGVLAVLHANEIVDLYGGVDTGMNTTFGDQAGDNNGAAAGVFGLGFNAPGGALTGVVLSHFGPELPSLASSQPFGAYNANHYFRYENDMQITYKLNDRVSITTDVNYTKDENPLIGAPEAWGIAQYASYSLTDTITLNARAEVFRDGKGFYVACFPGNLDAVNAQYGRYNTSIPGPHTTYGAITLGATWKPTSLPQPLRGMRIRPELRYDTNFGGSPAFNGGTSSNSFAIASDIVLQF